MRLYICELEEIVNLDLVASASFVEDDETASLRLYGTPLVAGESGPIISSFVGEHAQKVWKALTDECYWIV